MKTITELKVQQASDDNNWCYAKLWKSIWDDDSISYEVDSNTLGFKIFDEREEAENFYNSAIGS